MRAAHRAAFTLFVALTVPLSVLAQGAAPAAPAASTPSPGGARATKAEPVGIAPAHIQALVGHWGLVKAESLATPDFQPAFEAEYRNELRRLKSKRIQRDTSTQCIPSGMPGMMAADFWIEANSETMTILSGHNAHIRFIWLRDRAHPAENLLFPSWGGDAISHREGDTLVVDTVGIEAKSEIAWRIRLKDPQIHVVERFRQPSPNALEITTTLESPMALRKPWTYRTEYRRLAPEGDIPFCVPTRN